MGGGPVTRAAQFAHLPNGGLLAQDAPLRAPTLWIEGGGHTVWGSTVRSADGLPGSGIRRGLLKGEQLHALARCVHYGRLGRLDQRDFERQTGAASCLLLILAAIIYWQIREIDRVLSEAGSDADDLNFELLSHISPIGWNNVLLYGQYQLNRRLVRSERLSV